MTNSFRKHYNIIMWVIIVGTIISFVAYLSPGKGFAGFGGGVPAAGTIDGESVSQADFEGAQREAKVAYWIGTGHWPPSDSDQQVENEAFQLLLVQAKLRELGLSIPATEVQDFIRTQIFHLKPGQNMQKAKWEELVATELNGKGRVSQQDFEFWARDMAGQSLLAKLYGVNGATMTSTDAEFFFRRLHEDMTVELAKFPLTNYTGGINPTPQDIGQYFTNNQATYRLPDRVVVGYVHFDPADYNYAADAFLAGHTNFDQDVDREYLQHQPSEFKDASGTQMTPEESKKLIRDTTLLRARLEAATTNAYALANILMKGHDSTNSPISRADFEKFGETNKLKLITTAPFDRNNMPEDLKLAPQYQDVLFSLTTGDPTDQYKALPANPVTNGVYLVGLMQTLPSESQPLEAVRAKVIDDYRNEKAGALSDADGARFEAAAKAGLAKGETFDAICAEQKVKPVTLTPFAVDTTSIPDISDQNVFEAVARLCYEIPTGQCTQFIPHQYMTNGGFVAYVKQRTPVDESVVQRDLPAYLREQRQLREQAEFQYWFGRQFQLDIKRPAKPGATQS